MALGGTSDFSIFTLVQTHLLVPFLVALLVFATKTKNSPHTHHISHETHNTKYTVHCIVYNNNITVVCLV